MTESRLKIPLPVYVDDGENKETYLGNLPIDPRYELKEYHSQLSELSRKMGISPPHRISLFCRRNSRAKGIHRIQIYEKANLGTLLGREKDCYILISSKFSRKSVKGGKFHDVVEDEEYITTQKRFSSNDPPPKLLLRRDSPAIPLQFGHLNYSQIPSSPAQTMYGNQGLRLGLRNYENLLQMQKENCLMSYNSKYPYTDIAKNYEEYGYGRDVNGGGGVRSSESRAKCEVCLNAKGLQTEFHCCVLDTPIPDYFQSKFGPIARPSKG